MGAVSRVRYRPARSNFLALPLLLAVMAFGCGDSVDAIDSPPATSMVAFQNDPFLPAGIRPDPDAPDGETAESGAIIVEWNTIDPARLGSLRLGGYNLYRSETRDGTGAARDFRLIRKLVAEPEGSRIAYSDSTVRQNRGYCYYVRGYSRIDENLEGARSDTVRFTLTDRPVPLSPSGTIPAASPASLYFRFGPSSASGYVAVELVETEPENEKVVLQHIWRQTAIADFDNPQIQYTGEPLKPGHRYRWRVAKIFPQGEPIGNSSRWVTFLVQ